MILHDFSIFPIPELLLMLHVEVLTGTLLCVVLLFAFFNTN